MAESILNCRDPRRADVVLIAAPYDRTSSFGKGADRGPAAIRECLDRQIEFFDRVSAGSPAERLAIAWETVEGLERSAPETMVERVEQAWRAHEGRFRILVGGEHSVSNAPFRALAARSSEITIVQIDAHADLRPDDSDYNDRPHGPLAHCSVMRRAHDLGFALVQVGIRAYSAEERDLFDDPRVTVWEADGTPLDPRRIVESIPTREVYLTLDADGLDPAVMPATGTPVPGGLGWHETVELLRTLTSRHTLVGADLVEVCPRTDDRRTEYAAAQLIYSLIGLAA